MCVPPPPHCLPPSPTGLPSDSDLSDLESALRASGVDVTALQYVRTLKRNNLTGQGAKADGMGGSSALGLASQNNLLDWADKTFGQGLSQVTKVAKTLLSGEDDRATTRLLTQSVRHTPRQPAWRPSR